jgi:hypothetical protein
MDKQLVEFKNMIENAIYDGGEAGKNACIRSQAPINLIHDAVKEDLIEHGVRAEYIYPPIGATKPEIKLTGFLKQKDQDVCVTPKRIKMKETPIDWGLMAYQHKKIHMVLITQQIHW